LQLFRSGTNKHSQVTVPGLPYNIVGGFRGCWTPSPVHTDSDANFRPNLKTAVSVNFVSFHFVSFAFNRYLAGSRPLYIRIMMPILDPISRLVSNKSLFKPQYLKNNPSKNIYPFSAICDKKITPCQTY
jgi:hypothetical protein